MPTLCSPCSATVPDGVRVCPACGALQPVGRTPSIAPQTEIDLGWGRIVVDARVGEGGMGQVWRGWLFHAPGTPRAGEAPLPIALKVLAPRMRAHREIRELFAREADALSKLHHPNVVGFYSVVERGDDFAIAMEYVDGDTLEDVIARHVARARLAGPTGLRAMPFRRAWHYFQQLLGALAAVHALGLVHRDVKPANVLIRRDGIVKLGDFGIAQLATTPTGPHQPDTLAAGTGAYMSPEQVLSQPIDGRSDLYSAAIVLYEMLSGRTPFLVEERGEVLVRHDHVATRPPAFCTLVPQAPPVLDVLFARALAKDPHQRFADAVEMGEAFRAAMGIPDSEEWRAQSELAAQATRVEEPARTARMATLRGLLVERYRTAKMQAV